MCRTMGLFPIQIFLNGDASFLQFNDIGLPGRRVSDFNVDCPDLSAWSTWLAFKYGARIAQSSSQLGWCNCLAVLEDHDAVIEGCNYATGKLDVSTD